MRAVLLVALLAGSACVAEVRPMPRPVKPPETSQRPAARAKTPRVIEEGTVRIAMLGDSMTEGWNWAEAFGIEDLGNFGVISDQTRDILKRLDNVDSWQPTHVVLMAGINDVYAERKNTQIAANIGRIVDHFRSRDVEVVLQATVECRRNECGERVDQVRALNPMLRSLAEKRGLTFVDPNPVLTDEDGLRDGLTSDGIHLTPNGYRAWAERLAPVVTALD